MAEAAKPTKSLSQQISDLMTVLDQPNLDLSDDAKEKIFSWVRDLPKGNRPVELVRRVARMAGKTEEEYGKELDPDGAHTIDFERLVPKCGWLYDYDQLTRKIESPTPYNFFCGAVALSSALARNVYFRRGDKVIYPNLAVVLVGPSGRVRKTTACEIAMKLFAFIGGNILADKTTPEHFIESFKGQASTIGLLYAPELAVLLGKQKYMEGMIPMLTRLLDNPDIWRSGTIMRGAAELRNVGLTMLAASTLDWIQHAIPRDAFGGGFMSRLIFVVQERTPRSFPEPPPLDDALARKLVEQLRLMTQIRGEFKRTEEAYEWWCTWYTQVTDRVAANKHFAGYLARVPEQVWRLSMVLAISEGAKTGNLLITKKHFEHASQIMEWVESFLPGTFDQLTENAAGVDQMAIVQQLKQLGGTCKHSDLLRKNARRMNAETFRKYIDTLRAAGVIEFDAANRTYFVTPEGWRMS